MAKDTTLSANVRTRAQTNLIKCLAPDSDFTKRLKTASGWLEPGEDFNSQDMLQMVCSQPLND